MKGCTGPMPVQKNFGLHWTRPGRFQSRLAYHRTGDNIGREHKKGIVHQSECKLVQGNEFTCFEEDGEGRELKCEMKSTELDQSLLEILLIKFSHFLD